MGHTKSGVKRKIDFSNSIYEKSRGQLLADLQAKLKQMKTRDSQNTNIKMRAEIKKVQKQIDYIYSLEIQKKLTFLKQKNMKLEQNQVKFWPTICANNKWRTQFVRLRILKLDKLKIQGKKIKQCFEMFYRELYTQPAAASEECITEFLNSLKLLEVKGFQNEMLIKPITIKEVNVVISKLKSAKSPRLRQLQR